MLRKGKVEKRRPCKNEKNEHEYGIVSLGLLDSALIAKTAA